MLNRLLARTTSQGMNFDKMPLSFTSHLSFMAPPAADETNETVATGVQATNNLHVGLSL